MADRPNVVFLLADQLRLQSCGYSGGYAEDPDPYTPNLDALAEESADFRNAVAVNPVCCAYRASLFTGKYPSSTGMVINELRAMPDPDAIAHVLAPAGYHTGYIGKWHLYGKDHTPEQQFIPPGPHRLGFDDEWASFNFNHEYYKGFYYRDTVDRIDVAGYEPHTHTDLAIDFLQRASNDEQPFALFVSYGPPHDPWDWDNCPETFNHLFRGTSFPDPPNYRDGHARYWHPEWDEQWWIANWKPHRERYRQVYAAQTASLDWEVGRVLHAMADLGLDNDTLVVFTSDHGEMFGSQGRIAKKIFYEEAARVPFLMRLPGRIRSGLRDACLNTPDIAPTLLGILGIDVPPSMEGTDLSFVAETGEGPEPEAAFMQGMGHTFQWHDGDEWRAVRTKRFTYARMLADESEYLFDNEVDPYQTDNLIAAAGSTDVRERLSRWMDEKMSALGDPFKPTTWYRGRWVEDREIRRSAATKSERRPSTGSGT